MSFKKNETLKILWSIDAFDDLADLQTKSVQVLQRFAKNAKLKVDPVYVLSPDQLGTNLEFSGEWAKVYAPAAKKGLQQKLSGVEVLGLGEPQVLIHNRPSLKGAVQTLATYAKSTGYDLIIVGSHGRRGIKRALLGSFAEQLLLESEVPVFILGGHSEAWGENWKQKSMHILIPNDLTNPRSAFLAGALDFAETLEAKATLLNVLPRPIEPVFQSGVYLLSGGWVPAPVYLEEERNLQEQAVETVATRARKRGIPCEGVVDSTSSSIVEAILSYAREHQVSFITMAAESGPVAAAFLGSITRQVVRSAPCPVLVFRVKEEQ